MKLHLGVVDIPYEEGGKTTGDVAELLENRYHVMEIFYTERQQKIGDWLAEAIGNQLADVIGGAPVSHDPFMEAEEDIRASFQEFIETEEIARINPETPTQAAVEGRTKRRKNQQGPRRPSFVDTGAYVASMRAWVDET